MDSPNISGEFHVGADSQSEGKDMDSVLKGINTTLKWQTKMMSSEMWSTALWRTPPLYSLAAMWSLPWGPKNEQFQFIEMTQVD